MVTEAAQDQQTAALVLANVGQDVLVLHEVGSVGTTGDNGQLLTQGDEAPVVGQDPPPRLLALDIDGPLVGGPQPGPAGSESGAGGLGGPLHGGACVVAGLGVDDGEGLLGVHAAGRELLVGIAGLDIDVVLDGQVGRVGHSDLLAHVDVRRSAQQVDDSGQHGRGLDVVVHGIGEAVDGARLVMVVPEQGVPAATGLHTQGPLVEDALESGEVVGDAGPLGAVGVVDLEVMEAEDHAQLTIGRVGVADTGLDGG